MKVHRDSLGYTKYNAEALAERFKLAETPEAADQIVRDMLKTSPSPSTRALTFLLKLVAINGTEDAARLLLQRGAEIHGGIIANSIYHNQVSVLQVVIDAGWDVNTPMKYQGDALAIAIHYNKADAVRLLLNSGAHPRENEGSQGNTTLGDAAVRGSPDIISMLIESGVKSRRAGRWSWLHALGVRIMSCACSRKVRTSMRYRI